MPGWIQKCISIVIVTVLLASAVYAYRIPIVLQLISLYFDTKMQPEENRKIAWASGKDPRPKEQRPPNVVLILADDLGWNDITFNGGGVADGKVPTPNIDSIAAGGVTFTNGYAANATCAPSRASMLSGRYSTRFGFEFTPTPSGMMAIGRLAPRDPTRHLQTISHSADRALAYEDMGMPSTEITIAELLKQKNYHTAHIGKWHVGENNGMDANSQGFEESLLMASGLYLPEDSPHVVNAKQNFDFIDQFFWKVMRYAVRFNDGPPFQPNGHLTEYFTKEAVRVIENNKDRPFFLYLAHWAPHSPLQSSREDYDALPDIELHRERVYAGLIRGLDRGVGEVLKALKDNGLEDNTIVIFTSDNGGAGYLGLPDLNQPYRVWKSSFFEGGIHVPYFLRWPDQIEPGTTVNEAVHHFDIYTTIANAAGASLPKDRKIDGVDLLPIVHGNTDSIQHRALFWRSGASQSALIDGWKLNISDPPGNAWLYDLANDPTEQNNLAQSHPEKLRELQTALSQHNKEQPSSAWPAMISVPINLDRDGSQAVQANDEFIYWSN